VLDTQSGQVYVVKEDGIQEIPRLPDLLQLHSWKSLAGPGRIVINKTAVTPGLMTAWSNNEMTYQLKMDSQQPAMSDSADTPVILINFLDSLDSVVAQISLPTAGLIGDSVKVAAENRKLRLTAGKYASIEKFSIGLPSSVSPGHAVESE